MVDQDCAVTAVADIPRLPAHAASNRTTSVWCPSPRERGLIWQQRQLWLVFPLLPAVFVPATLLMRFILTKKLGFLLAVLGPGVLAAVTVVSFFRWLERRSHRQPAIAILLTKPVSGSNLSVRAGQEFRPVPRSSRAAGQGALGCGFAAGLMCLLACRVTHPASMLLNVLLLTFVSGMLTLEWFICRRTRVTLETEGLVLRRPSGPDVRIDWADMLVVQQPLPVPLNDGRVTVRTWLASRRTGKLHGLRPDLDGFDELVAAILERVPSERHVHPFLPAAS